MNVTIIGTGRMGTTLSTLLLEGDHNVTLVGHTPDKAVALASELKNRAKRGSISAAMENTLPGEMVILAVFFPAVESIIHKYIELLPGKVLVDIINPIDFKTMEPLFPGSSGAEQIAKMVPLSTRVVKAFNTTFGKTMLAGTVAGMPLDVFMAGDDEEAKARVARLTESWGMRVIDAGPLRRARLLEALGALHIALQSARNTGYMSSIKILV